MNKSKLRKKYIEIRKGIIDKEKKSLEILRKITSLEEYKKSKVIALYYSLSSEVDTINLINYSLENKKIVLLPKVLGEDMVFYEIKSLDGLKKSSFGVMEAENGIEYNKELIDLVIVPGVCFDKHLNRIGFGKGYYDKYLEGYNGLTIGICFEEQMSEENIEVDKNDVQLKYIITEKNIYS